MTAEPPGLSGPYRIIDKLGEGGGAVVYRAEQSEPVQRQVALKVLKRGLDSDQVIRRGSFIGARIG